MTPDLIDEAREVGRNALKESLRYCLPEVKQEIIEAIEKSKYITTSPFLEAKE
jgi:hypothetical protein